MLTPARMLEETALLAKEAGPAEYDDCETASRSSSHNSHAESEDVCGDSWASEGLLASCLGSEAGDVARKVRFGDCSVCEFAAQEASTPTPTSPRRDASSAAVEEGEEDDATDVEIRRLSEKRDSQRTKRCVVPCAMGKLPQDFAMSNSRLWQRRHSV